MAKKKKKKSQAITMIVLFLVIIALGIGYFVAKSYAENSGEKKYTMDDKKLIQVDVSKAKKLQYTLKGKDYTFLNENGIWKVESEKDRPLNQDAMNQIVGLFSEMTAIKIVYENQDKLADLGLDKPALKVTLTMDSGENYSYSTGVAVVTEESGCYAIAQGFPGIYTLPEGYYKLFEEDLTEITEIPSINDVNSSNITKIKVTKDSKALIDLSKDKSTEEWIIKEPYDSSVRIDAKSMNFLTSNYVSYRFIKNIDYNCTDFSKYGLDKPASEIYVEYFTKDTKSGEKTDHKIKLSIGSSEEGAVYYVRLNDGSSVYTMSTNAVIVYTKIDAFTYVYKTLVDTDIANVAKASFTAKGKTYDLQVERNGAAGTEDKSNSENGNVYKLNGVHIKGPDVGTFFNKVNQIEFVGQLDKKVDTSKLACSINVTDIDNKQLNYNFYEYDENYYAVEHEGHSYFLVDMRRVDDMVQALEAL